MKTEEFAAAIGNINDGELILRSAERIEKPRKTWLRFAAAAAAILLVLGAVFAAVKLLPANAPRQEAAVPKEAVLPPARFGENNPAHPWGHTVFLSFSEFCFETYAVCEITIGDWIGDNGYCTYFEATVDKLYRGELPEKIKIYQAGCQDHTYENYPLFTYGDKLLVALKPWVLKEGFDDGFDRSNAYELCGGDIGVLHISRDKNGEKYLLDLSTMFSQTNEIKGGPEFTNYGYNRKLLEELCENIAEYDPVVADMMLHRSKYWISERLQETYVYSYDEFIEYLTSR